MTVVSQTFVSSIWYLNLFLLFLTFYWQPDMTSISIVIGPSKIRKPIELSQSVRVTEKVLNKLNKPKKLTEN